MPVAILLVACSVVLAVFATVLAVRLLRLTGQRTPWTLIVVAAGLMTVRHCLTLFDAFQDRSPNVLGECLALSITALLLAGLARFVPLLRAMKRTESALRESEARTRDMLETTQEGIWRFDHTDRTTYVNETQALMLGYRPADIVGRTLFELDALNDAGKAQARNMLAGLRRGERQHVELPFRHRSGSELWALVSASPIFGADGSYTGALGMVIDITEHKRFQAEKLRMQEQLIERQKLESLGLLAGGIAHDFNNLLVGILSNAELAARMTPEAEPTHEALKRIQKAAERASGLTRQMLAYSGKGPTQVQNVALSEQIGEIVDLIHSSVPKNVTLDFELAENLPTLEADTAQLQQVVMNIIINAAESIGSQEGRVSIHTSAVDIDGPSSDRLYPPGQVRAGRYLCLEVRDDGCGMNAETRARIFDPFFTTKFTGRGLGLAAVLGIVRSHGGALDVLSLSPRGTAFRLYFPAMAESPAKVVARNAAPARPHQATVLLIDDEEIVRTAAQASMEAMGYTVMAADSGRRGLEIYDERSDEIDVVLLDMTMPEMSGAEVYEELQLRDTNARVVLTSGYHESAVAHRFTAEGGAAFIQKPYTLDELAATLDGALESEAAVV